jgi:hypothetical protein
MGIDEIKTPAKELVGLIVPAQADGVLVQIDVIMGVVIPVGSLVHVAHAKDVHERIVAHFIVEVPVGPPVLLRPTYLLRTK